MMNRHEKENTVRNVLMKIERNSNLKSRKESFSEKAEELLKLSIKCFRIRLIQTRLDRVQLQGELEL